MGQGRCSRRALRRRGPGEGAKGWRGDGGGRLAGADHEHQYGELQVRSRVTTMGSARGKVCCGEHRGRCRLGEDLPASPPALEKDGREMRQLFRPGTGCGGEPIGGARCHRGARRAQVARSAGEHADALAGLRSGAGGLACGELAAAVAAGLGEMGNRMWNGGEGNDRKTTRKTGKGGGRSSARMKEGGGGGARSVAKATGPRRRRMCEQMIKDWGRLVTDRRHRRKSVIKIILTSGRQYLEINAITHLLMGNLQILSRGVYQVETTSPVQTMQTIHYKKCCSL
jgi:hypothetical protein